MPNKFPHLRAAMVRQPWAMMPHEMEALVELVERRVDGLHLSRAELDAIKAEGRPANGALMVVAFDDESDDWEMATPEPYAAVAADPNSPSVVAVINVFGVVAQRSSMMDDLCGGGGTSVERLTQSFRQAKADPNVVAIVFNYDSPGGSVFGVQMLGDEIFKARGEKPIIAQVNSLCASAAYWLAAQADEIVMTPGAEAGSIGVYALHQDVSKAAEAAGVKFTFISAGKFKVEGNQFEPLTDEAAAAAQTTVDQYYDDFTAAVARGRNVKVADVVNGFGEGRTMKDRFAVKAGLADRVGTLDDTIRRVGKKKPGAAARSSLATPERVAEARPIILRSFADGTVKIQGEWSELMLVSAGFEGERIARDDATGAMTITVANGSAVYQLEAVTEGGDWLYVKQSSTITEPLAPEPDPAIAAADADSFRRRRHALRLRGATE